MADDGTDLDPFSPTNAPALQLLTLMRIYDVLMAKLAAEHPMAAEKLDEIHSNGKLMGSLPWLDMED